MNNNSPTANDTSIFEHDLGAAFNKHIKLTKADNLPFPHLILDDFLTQSTLDEIEKNWPDKNSFGVEGHDQHDLRFRLVDTRTGAEDQLDQVLHPLMREADNSKSLFWKAFINGPLYDVGRYCLNYFSSFISGWRPDFNSDFFMQLVWLEDAPKHYHETGLRVHTHYDSHPLWAVSFLIYLDSGDCDVPGTNIQWPDGCSSADDYVDKALNSRRWYNDNSFKIHNDTQFKRNRLISFVDGPLSFHGVKPFEATSDQWNRKAVLVHIGWEPDDFMARYGMSVNEFSDKQFAHEVDDRMRALVKEDVEAYLKAREGFKADLSSGFNERLKLNKSFDEIEA